MPIIWMGEVLLIALTAVGGVTQIIIPLWRNTPMFPYFSRKQKLLDVLTHVRGEIDEAEVDELIDYEIDRHNSGSPNQPKTKD